MLSSCRHGGKLSPVLDVEIVSFRIGWRKVAYIPIYKIINNCNKVNESGIPVRNFPSASDKTVVSWLCFLAKHLTLLSGRVPTSLPLNIFKVNLLKILSPNDAMKLLV